MTLPFLALVRGWNANDTTKVAEERVVKGRPEARSPQPVTSQAPPSADTDARASKGQR